jgi:TolA-binding protein
VWHGGDMVRLTPGATWKGPATTPASNRRSWSIGRRRAAPEHRLGLALTAGESRMESGGEVRAGGEPPAPVTRPSDRFRAAKAALAAGQTERGMSILWSLAEGSGPVAENASYELGRALRDQLTSPREAIEAWNRYRTRFPRGLLRAEADISILETLLSVGDRNGALAEADAFLRRHPQSERRVEVERLAERLRLSAEARAAGGL